MDFDTILEKKSQEWEKFSVKDLEHFKPLNYIRPPVNRKERRQQAKLNKESNNDTK